MDNFFYIDKKTDISDKRAAKWSARCFFALVFIPVLIASCAGSPAGKPESRTGGGAPQFVTWEDELGIPLFPDDPEESPRLRIYLKLAALKGAQKDDGLAAAVRETLYGGMEPQNYAEAFIDAKVAEYQAMGDQVDREDRGESLNWEYIEIVEPLPAISRLLILSRSREYYWGGAHGMREKRFFTFDRDTEKLLKLEDLIRSGALEPLGELLTGALRRYAGLEPDAPLSAGGFLVDTVVPTDNFFLTGEGLGFQWDPYEIAPYVTGPIQIIIPLETVRDLLVPAYRIP